MTDLFDTDPHDESQYAANLRQQARDDLEAIMEQGRIPPWLELDSVLQRDEYRILDLIEERGGYVMGDDVTVTTGTQSLGLFDAPTIRRIDSLTYDAGFVSPGNCQATVNRCIAEGWVTRGVDAVTGRERLDLTRMGRFAKELCETDMYWDQMED